MRSWLRAPVWATLIAGCAAGPALAQGAEQFTGPINPCRDSKAEYQYCKTENFPYTWSWSVSDGATLRVLANTPTCYRAEVTFTDRGVTLTFHQQVPPTLPQVYDVHKYIQPRKCPAPAAAGGAKGKPR